ncbi:hypothetical protein [Endozoicomonas sp. SCSIO W0465]|uniref:hypothetical protein n=1 Tax=Endozoicomonas sp. SCSIO W0465 TaxID=2918516 RepID=UPI002075D7E3|nr:hypothetical protein [Endozoicomonas sp. SCSIO W0465]USE38882.1 hypothetical protein MJO57_12355 [Endozoicomonas sp. SCSIO W0465]
MSYPNVIPTSTHLGHARFSAPTMEKDSRRSIWSSVGRAAGKAVAMPFRLASTVVNGGVFAAYYVTTMAITGLAATGGTVFGMAKIATDHIRGKPHKSLSEYAITPARKTFNFMSRLYNELPKHGAECIFAGVAIAAVTAVAIIAMSQGGGDCGSGCGNVFIFMDTTHHHYHGGGGSTGYREYSDDDYNPSGLAAILHPYRPSIVLGRKIMGKTTRILNQGHEVD